MSKTPGWVEALARLLLGSLFLLQAARSLVQPGSVMKLMIESGAPGGPATFVIGLTLILLGSLGLILGYRTRAACGALILVLVVQVLFIYPPWYAGVSSAGPYPLLMRIGILGGLLLVVYHGPGPLSFDAHKLVPVRRKR